MAGSRTAPPFVSNRKPPTAVTCRPAPTRPVAWLPVYVPKPASGVPFLETSGWSSWTQARQTHEGLGSGAEGHAQPGHLGQAAGDEGSAGVQAQFQAVAQAGGNGQHVFDGTAYLHANDVVACIDAQAGAVKAATRASRTLACALAATRAVGWPRATSCAKLGPLKMPASKAGAACACISCANRLF